MKALCAIVLVLLSGCALTGNTGPVELECQEPDRVLEDGTVLRGGYMKLKLPMGSGRVFPAQGGAPALDGTDSPCGFKIQEIQQGEDRSSGLWGLLKGLLGLP